MTISLHIVADNCPQDRLDRALLYLQRVKPPTVDIAAGAELLKGMQFAERVRRDVPGIKIFWRNLEIEDTGIHTKMSAAAVYQKKVVPHLAWFKRNEIVFMPDNESSGDDNAIRRYVQWQVEMAVLLHSDNLRGAFARFSSGTIDDGGKGSNQYPLLKPIFSAMIPGDYVSPNEYSPLPGYKAGGGGHLERYKLMWKAAGYELPTVIGEAGIAMNYDPGKGYIDAGMSDEACARQLLDEEIWYGNGKIDRHVYLIGGFTHEGYRLRDGVLDYWERHYARQPPVVITPPTLPPPPLDAIVPSDLGNALAVRVTGDNWYLRSEPRVSAEQIGKLMAGEEVKLYPSTATLADDQSYKVVKRIIPVAGEASTAWTAYPTPTNAPSVPDDNLNTIARLIVIRAKIHAMASLMEDVVKDIHQMELDLAASEAAKAAELASAA